jgi:TetR/AcrR family transcriptional repressor of nem operon
MSPRPKEFDPEEALDAAMHLFWRKGYESTTMQDLVDHMGINRFSIYDTFGDKRRLFIAAAKRYSEAMIGERIAALDAAESGLRGVRDHFRFLEQWCLTEHGRAGCLMTNTIVEKGIQDADLRRQGLRLFERLEEAFSRALRRARRDGEIQTRENLTDLARYLVAVQQGLHVLAKVRPAQREVRAVVRVALSVLR